SFKNWVKEYEAGNINANPADFGPSADADGEADPDPDHEPDQDPDTSVSSAAQPQLQFTASPYIANEQPRNGNGNGASAGPSYSNNGQFSSTPPIGPAPPPTAAPQAFSQFNVPQEAGDVAANAEGEQKAEGTGAESTNEVNANANANANVCTSNATGFPPMYPLVYPPVDGEQKEGA
ncbi:hypothetical protein FRC06_010857, partial [Ceratobasidium sp. 370]